MIGEVYGHCNALSYERRCYFLDAFEDFLQDKYRDLLLREAFSLCGNASSGSEPKMSGRCRRGSPGQKLFLALRQGLRVSRCQADPLEAYLSRSVGNLVVPKLMQELQTMHIRHFGTHSWGSELFEKQKDILFQIKRPCGVTESGGAKKMENLAMIQASEISPFFVPEEAAACSVTLITEPSMSSAGQVMSVARDAEGTLERIILEHQLPADGPSNDVAQAG
eukprot:symbB.v1.2.004839.t1/scaffold279.1/size242841/24